MALPILDDDVGDGRAEVFRLVRFLELVPLLGRVVCPPRVGALMLATIGKFVPADLPQEDGIENWLESVYFGPNEYGRRFFLCERHLYEAEPAWQYWRFKPELCG